MPKTLRTARHLALVQLLIERRKRASMTQADVAKRLGRYQSFVASVEGGQRRLDVVEFLQFAEAIGFDAAAAVRRLSKVRP